MKIIIEKEHIIEGLQKAASIIPTRTGAAYLRSLWLKAEGNTLSIMATDANIEFCGTYTAKVEKSGLVGVQGRSFIDLIRQLPMGPIHMTLDSDSNTLLLEYGRCKYTLPVNDAMWFQNFSAFPDENAIAWSGDFFKDILEKTIFCISDDDTMEGISCLYIKTLPESSRIDICGLNGHQFAMVSFTNDDFMSLLPEEGILLQKKYLQELKKWLSNDAIEINISDKRFYVRTIDGKEELSLPRATYTYPDYNVFLEKIHGEKTIMYIDRKECINALGRIYIFNTDNERCTSFNISENEAVLFAQGQDIGSANEYLEIKYDGNIDNIAFPTKNLIDILGRFNSDTINMIMTGKEGPCGIQGKDDVEYTVIIMPMKVTETTYYNEENM